MMQKVKWILLILVFVVFLTTPLSAFAASTPGTKQAPRIVTWANIAGHSIILSPGQERIIPYDKGTFHVKMSQQTIVPKGLNSSIKSPSTTSYSMGTFEVAWYDVFGWKTISYTIYQEFGYNGSSITWLPASSDGYSSNFGWQIQSHNNYNGWVSRSWSAYAHGNYDFIYGFPTPWGGVGFTRVAGWVETHIYGNGYDEGWYS